MTAPAFFVPGVTEDKAEEVFAALAKFAGCSVPPPDERVYRIEWVHNGERWTGEVGKQMHGEELPVPRRKPKAWTRKVSDPATVHAIFPGVPYIVVTDKRPIGRARSAWENPFMAGSPAKVDYFSPPA
jgi:hypothetical protein